MTKLELIEYVKRNNIKTPVDVKCSMGNLEFNGTVAGNFDDKHEVYLLHNNTNWIGERSKVFNFMPEPNGYKYSWNSFSDIEIENNNMHRLVQKESSTKNICIIEFDIFTTVNQNF